MNKRTVASAVCAECGAPIVMNNTVYDVAECIIDPETGIVYYDDTTWEFLDSEMNSYICRNNPSHRGVVAEQGTTQVADFDDYRFCEA